jgi:hypothetical protein
MDPASILAHQGGWDEALYVAIPALALLYALRRAEKRARANAEAREAAEALKEEAGPQE